MSTRVLDAEFPPEPEGRAVAIDADGVAWQRDPASAMPTFPGVPWIPVGTAQAFPPHARTWRQLHAAGAVVVAWDPSGRDYAVARALATYETGDDE